MKIRPWAEFEADFPIDGDDDENGNITIFPGQAVAEAIAEILKDLGYETGAPEHAHEHGWEFSFKGSSLWCQVTFIDRWLFVCEPNVLFGPPRRDRELHVEVLNRLNAAFQQDPRFGEIHWYTGDEVQSGLPGTKDPVVL